MPSICPICSKPWRTGQAAIQCSTCSNWIHHCNNLNCTGLTNQEFKMHTSDNDLFWQCDVCTASIIAKDAFHLPDISSIEDTVLKCKKPHSRLDNLKSVREKHGDFINKCSQIENFLNLNEQVDEYVLSSVNSKYIDVEDYNALDINNSTSFEALHVNVASLDCHIDDLRFLISNLCRKPDIIGISEHKIPTGTEPSNNIRLHGYNEFTFTPTNSTHGGVGFYIKENTTYFERNALDINSTSDYETKFIEIKFEHKKPLIIGCVYRHPSSIISITDFSTIHLEPVLTKISNENKMCIVMGDFNINLLKTDTNNAYNLFLNTMTSHNYSPYILQPSRLQAKTLIDNIFINSLQYHSSSGNLLIELSDHLVQYLILEEFHKENKKKPEPNILKRDFRNFNEREFFDEVINKTDWDEVCNLDGNDPNQACKQFYDTINFHLDEFAPYRKLTRKELELTQKPWITNSILKKCKQRNALLKKISKSTNQASSAILRSDYKALRNEITAEKRRSKKEYFTTYFETNKNKTSEIWKRDQRSSKYH